MAGCAYLNLSGVNALLLEGGETLDLEAGFYLNDATALGIACYMSTYEIAEVLLQHGASIEHLNHHGDSKLTNVCQNAAAEERFVDLVLTAAQHSRSTLFDVNYKMKSTTTKWSCIDLFFRLLVRSGISRSALALDIAHSEGATALHYAARTVSACLVCTSCVP